LYLDEEGLASLLPESIDDGSTDECGIESLNIDKTDFTCDDLGENIVILSAIDFYGNIGTCNSIVTILDNLPPALSDVPNRTENLDGSCTFILPDYTTLTTAQDNCGNVGLSQQPEAWTALSGVGTHVITLTAMDGSGNTAATTSEVTL